MIQVLYLFLRNYIAIQLSKMYNLKDAGKYEMDFIGFAKYVLLAIWVVIIVTKHFF